MPAIQRYASCSRVLEDGDHRFVLLCARGGGTSHLIRTDPTRKADL
jgi:hypothetical protein